jgi:methanethiol S-methyltransferase
MTRFIAFLYGLVAYFVFFGTILYAIGFVTGLVVPKTIDAGTVVPLTEAIIVNLLLMSLFAVQHSVMARPQFKAWWTQYVPKSVERSTYVLLASLALVLLFWQWRPIPTVVWQVADPTLATAILGLSLFGWVLVFTSTFLINHFELFGLHQVVNNLTGRPMPQVRFKTPMLYNFVRHPIYLGFIIAFWAAPTMTAGHLLFAAVTTAYIFVGIFLEEHDLIEMFGDEYRRYRERVSMLVPWRKSA